jgi:hypothetical protein
MTRRRRTPPYWLVGGTERCEVCYSVYVLEMERRCTDCDRGVCEQCAVHIRERHEIHCHGCHDDNGKDD